MFLHCRRLACLFGGFAGFQRVFLLDGITNVMRSGIFIKKRLFPFAVQRPDCIQILAHLPENGDDLFGCRLFACGRIAPFGGYDAIPSHIIRNADGVLVEHGFQPGEFFLALGVFHVLYLNIQICDALLAKVVELFALALKGREWRKPRLLHADLLLVYAVRNFADVCTERFG